MSEKKRQREREQARGTRRLIRVFVCALTHTQTHIFLSDDAAAHRNLNKYEQNFGWGNYWQLGACVSHTLSLMFWFGHAHSLSLFIVRIRRYKCAKWHKKKVNRTILSRVLALIQFIAAKGVWSKDERQPPFICKRYIEWVNSESNAAITTKNSMPDASHTHVHV